MSLKDMTKEELEILSYTDLTYILLKDNKKTMNTPTLFKLICNLLEYSDEDYKAKIGDYYTSLTIDKRFVLLDNAEWDIRDNHKIELVVDDDDDEMDETEESDIDNEDDIEESEEEDNIDSIDEDLDDVDEDLEDLAIVDEDESEEE